MLTKFEALAKKSFDTAIELDENINSDCTINWNFVSADIWMDLCRDGAVRTEKSELNDLIDSMIEGHIDWMSDLAFADRGW